MMRYSRLAALLMLVAGGAPAASAQAASADSVAAACRDTAVVGSYVRCALWLDGGVVRRGPDRLTIAKGGLFKPIPLASLVQGDSARSYALVYEQTSRRAAKVWVAGLVLEVAAIFVLHDDDCGANIFGCSGRGDGRTFVGGTLLFISLGTVVESSNISLTAYRAATRSIWWHNARYGH